MYANKKTCPAFALRQVILRWVGVGKRTALTLSVCVSLSLSLCFQRHHLTAPLSAAALRQAELRSRIRIVQCDNCESRDRIIEQLKRTEQQVQTRSSQPTTTLTPCATDPLGRRSARCPRCADRARKHHASDAPEPARGLQLPFGQALLAVPRQGPTVRGRSGGALPLGGCRPAASAASPPELTQDTASFVCRKLSTSGSTSVSALRSAQRPTTQAGRPPASATSAASSSRARSAAGASRSPTSPRPPSSSNSSSSRRRRAPLCLRSRPARP